jgi:hypothetical protein
MGFFRFQTNWRLASAPSRVYNTLADVERYPQWWPQVKVARQLDEDSGELICRSMLPVSLRLIARRDIEDADSLRLRATLSGDLIGWSSWQIEPDGKGSIATFTEEVSTTGALKAAARFARPVLEWNHAAMMRGGERGLRTYLARP